MITPTYLSELKDYSFQAFGNGSTALYASLQAVKCAGNHVAVPATTCPAAIAAIYASANTPLFVDIELTRFGLDPEKLKAVMHKVGAVIAIHGFGIPCRIEEIQQMCRSHSVPLIEDCAQAEGAVCLGKAVGSYGDVAIFSYGSGKIISAGGGGAAITNNPNLSERIKSIHDRLPSKAETRAHHELGLFYKFFYNQLYPERLERYKTIFTALLKDCGPRILARHDPAFDTPISEGWRGLNANIQSRLQKAALYKTLLGNTENIKILDFPSGSVPWRFNLHLDFSLRQFVLSRMLQAGLNVSSWYPDISQFLDDRAFEATSLDNSIWLERGILNLWVDDKTTPEVIRHSCQILHSLIREYRQTSGEKI